MNSKHHIDDLFRNGLSGMEKTPSDKGWSTMQSALDNIRVEHLAKAKLANQVLTPAKSVWHKIATKIWWQKFVQFSALKFNIYYASVALIGIGAGTIINSQDIPEYYEPIKELSVAALSQKEAYSPVSVDNVESLTLFVERNKKESSVFDLSVPNRVVPLAVNDDVPTDKRDIIGNKSDLIVKNNKIKGEINSIAPDESGMSYIHNEIRSEKETQEIDLFYLTSRLPFLVPVVLDAEMSGLDNVEERNDTLGFDYQGEPIVKDLKFVEQGWYGGILFMQQSLELSNPEALKVYVPENNLSRSSYRFGVRVNFVDNNKMIQTGLYFSNINNSFTHKTSHLVIHDTTPHLPFLEFEWPYKSDTIVEYRTHTYNNSYSYIELPVLFGTHLETNRFALNLKTGPVFNVICGVNAKLVMDANNEVSNIYMEDFKRPGIRWELSGDLIYKFDDRFSAYLEPAYVYDVLSSFNKQYALKSRFKGLSLGVGIYYRF